MTQRAFLPGPEKWVEIGSAMGRAGYGCRDKWRAMKGSPKVGEWSEWEVSKLEVRRCN